MNKNIVIGLILVALFVGAFVVYQKKHQILPPNPNASDVVIPLPSGMTAESPSAGSSGSIKVSEKSESSLDQEVTALDKDLQKVNPNDFKAGSGDDSTLGL